MAGLRWEIVVVALLAWACGEAKHEPSISAPGDASSAGASAGKLPVFTAGSNSMAVGGASSTAGTTDAGVPAQPDSGADSDSGPDPNPDSGPDPNPDSGPNPDPDPNPDPKPQSCGVTPHGAVLNRVRYQSASAPYGQVCNSENQTSLCLDGVFGAWSGSYAELTCMVEAPASCGEVAHGALAERVRFLDSLVPFKQSCKSERQVARCENGILTGWTGSYTFESCVAAGPTGFCTPDADGTATVRSRAAQATVPFGQACSFQTQTRACVNDEWTVWSGTFAAKDCIVAPPLPCGDVQHGSWAERTRYAAELDKSCKQERQRRFCWNGSFDAWTGTYTAETCTEVECLAGEWDWTWPDECSVGYARATCQDNHWVWSRCGRCADPCVGLGSGQACLDQPLCTTYFDGKSVRCINLAKYDCKSHGLEPACIEQGPYCTWIDGGPYKP